MARCPSLRDRPVAVAHALPRRAPASSSAAATQPARRSTSDVASCNYEARRAGVRNGMWVDTARRLCPDLVFVPYDFEAYRTVGKEGVLRGRASGAAGLAQSREGLALRYLRFHCSTWLWFAADIILDCTCLSGYHGGGGGRCGGKGRWNVAGGTSLDPYRAVHSPLPVPSLLRRRSA